MTTGIGNARARKREVDMGRKLIDKEQAYKTLSKYYHHTGMIQHQALREALDRVPVVDAVPVRHGRWIGYPECLKYKSDIECSVCGEVFNILSNETKRFDYCPHCGAKMGAGE